MLRDLQMDIVAYTAEYVLQSQCSKLIRSLLGVPIVNSRFEYYRNAFLYTALLRWGVKVARFDLTPEQSQAAFAFLVLLQGPRSPAQRHSVPQPPTPQPEPMHVDEGASRQRGSGCRHRGADGICPHTGQRAGSSQMRGSVPMGTKAVPPAGGLHRGVTSGAHG